MTGFWVLDYLILAAILASAVLVVRVRNLSGAVMALSAAGTMMSLLFVVLGAPDVAHAEVVVGAIALPVLYLVAIGKVRAAVPGQPDLKDRPHRRWLGLAIAAAVAAAVTTAMAAIPREHAPLPAVARYAMEVALPAWKLTEPVNEIVYGTRGFDTFGETFLLLAAVVSVMVISRAREPRHGYFGESLAGQREQRQTDPPDRPDAAERAAKAAESEEEDTGRQDEPDTPDAEPLGTPAPERAEAMSVVVRTAIRVALPVLAVAGCYLVAEGFSPGGGFPGGAVLLGVGLLAYAGFGRRRVARVVRPGLLEGIEMAGAAAIILTELLGLVLKGSFSANWLPLAAPQTILSGGVAQLFSASELIEVGTGLGIAVFAMIGMRHDWATDTGAAGEDGAGQDSAGRDGGGR